MRLRRPRHASPDEVRITREADTAVIEYADSGIRGVSLRLGRALAAMTDEEILARFNAMLEAQAEFAAGVDRTLTEIPPGRPQIEYYESSGQWVPRGEVLRCHVAGRIFVLADSLGFQGGSSVRWTSCLSCGTSP